MNIVEVVKNASASVDEVFARAQAAAKKGDVDALFEASKAGAKPSLILRKASAIAAKPERYEHAEENFQSAAGDIAKVDPRKLDAMAKAEAMTRFNSARRRYSAVRTLEKIVEAASR